MVLPDVSGFKESLIPPPPPGPGQDPRIHSRAPGWGPWLPSILVSSWGVLPGISACISYQEEAELWAWLPGVSSAASPRAGTTPPACHKSVLGHAGSQSLGSANLSSGFLRPREGHLSVSLLYLMHCFSFVGKLRPGKTGPGPGDGSVTAA